MISGTSRCCCGDTCDRRCFSKCLAISRTDVADGVDLMSMGTTITPASSSSRTRLIMTQVLPEPTPPRMMLQPLGFAQHAWLRCLTRSLRSCVEDGGKRMSHIRLCTSTSSSSPSTDSRQRSPPGPWPDGSTCSVQRYARHSVCCKRHGSSVTHQQYFKHHASAMVQASRNSNHLSDMRHRFLQAQRHRQPLAAGQRIPTARRLAASRLGPPLL